MRRRATASVWNARRWRTQMQGRGIARYGAQVAACARFNNLSSSAHTGRLAAAVPFASLATLSILPARLHLQYQVLERCIKAGTGVT